MIGVDEAGANKILTQVADQARIDIPCPIQLNYLHYHSPGVRSELHILSSLLSVSRSALGEQLVDARETCTPTDGLLYRHSLKTILISKLAPIHNFGSCTASAACLIPKDVLHGIIVAHSPTIASQGAHFRLLLSPSQAKAPENPRWLSHAKHLPSVGISTSMTKTFTLSSLRSFLPSPGDIVGYAWLHKICHNESPEVTSRCFRPDCWGRRCWRAQRHHGCSRVDSGQGRQRHVHYRDSLQVRVFTDRARLA